MKTKLLAGILSALMLSAVFSGCSVVSNVTQTLTGDSKEDIDGYEYAEFEKYNSYAKDNGLDGTKIYVKGTVSGLFTWENICAGTLVADDGKWTVLFGYVSEEDISDYTNNEIVVFGVYTGFSDSTKHPVITAEKAVLNGSEKLFNQMSDLIGKVDETTSSTSSKGSYELETEQIDYHDLSNDEFAQKVADDFSTDKIKFKVDKYNDDMYFLKQEDTYILTEISVYCSEFGNSIAITFSDKSDSDDCYDVLAKGLKSDLFGISFDDQIDILAHYKVDKIEYKNTDNAVPFEIEEGLNDGFKMIFINFNR